MCSNRPPVITALVASRKPWVCSTPTRVLPTVVINGETYNVVLKIVDNQSATDKAPTAAQQLVSDNVSVVLGSYGSGVSIAAGAYL